MINPLKQVTGIDVAKNELVVSLGRMNPDTSIEVFANKCFANKPKGFSDLLIWIDKIMSGDTKVNFVMEATGIYHEAFAYYLFDKNQKLMNLSTAKASTRLKEAGIKKLVGAGKVTLISQYLSESLFMAFLSLGIAVIIVIALLPQFNQLTGKNIALHFDVRLILSALAITLFTGLVSGSYPLWPDAMLFFNWAFEIDAVKLKIANK